MKSRLLEIRKRLKAQSRFKGISRKQGSAGNRGPHSLLGRKRYSKAESKTSTAEAIQSWSSDPKVSGLREKKVQRCMPSTQKALDKHLQNRADLHHVPSLYSGPEAETEDLATASRTGNGED